MVRRAALTLVALIGVGAMGLRFVGEIRTTHRLSAARLDRQYWINLRQSECLTDEVHRLVPRGSTVYLGGGLDEQRLEELVVLWARPAPAHQASYRLTLSSAGHCAGQKVVAQR